MMTAKGNYFLGKGQFEVREMTFGEVGPEEVLIRCMAAGICGTDVHIYHGGKGSADVTPPVVLGHEFSGVVEKVGAAVTTVKPGDCVTVDPNIYCGRCRACRNGQKQFCENLSAVGVNRDGGFAQYCVAPQAQVFRMNPDIGFEAMAMTEPLACCLHGIEQIGIKAGDVACVIGGGSIGQLMVQLALLHGASQVVLSEPVAARREIALKLGACAAIDPMAGDVKEQFVKATGREDGADVLIECVGKNVAISQAFQLAARGARILLFSVPDIEAKFEMPVFEVFQKELRIYGSFINPDSHARAAELLNSGRVRTDLLVTHRFPLAQLEDAIKMQMSAESIKVQVLPQE
ncbi:MAG: zinc-dependent alcohol dehydrogenase family protein [Eubacteriales bacterium]|nr:zinc-dependent alcohol dehydrogenase family protein [Eubacteriales bacterium]